ncbi:uncharacterized protein LOC143030308 [Oratosquilla oratoria]|uniref:uncharacterized protein LOC143030308 n=1 Tax=Oratosquilla oratoria TaxID=337810 RepID=UPI003F776223
MIWYERVKRELITFGMSLCGLEPALFYWHQNGHLQGIVCTHVDDFLWSGTKCFERRIIDRLEEQSLIGTEEHKCFHYLGTEINQEDNGIKVNQDNYIKHGIKEIDISKAHMNRKGDEVNEKEKTKYRALMGQINWLATQTRLYVACDVCELSMAFNQTCVSDAVKVNKVIKKVKDNPVALWFGKVDLDGRALLCYSDAAAFANLTNHGSQGGHTIFLRDHDENGICLAGLLKTILGTQRDIPVTCLVNNKSLVDSLKSTTLEGDRSLRINLAVLRDMMDRGEIESVKWVETMQQLADCLRNVYHWWDLNLQDTAFTVSVERCLDTSLIWQLARPWCCRQYN